jgi:hypothetical protein
MWVVAFEAIVFVVSVVVGYLSSLLSPQENQLIFGTLISLCFYSASQYIKFSIDFRRLISRVRSIDKGLTSLDQRTAIRNSVIDKLMQAFEIRDQLIKEAVLRGVKDFSSSISIKDDGVALFGGELALKKTKNFGNY